MCTGIAAPRQCRQPARSMVLPLVRGRGPPPGGAPGACTTPPRHMAGTVGLGEVYLGTREPVRDSRGPTSRRVAPDLEPWAAICSREMVRHKILYVLRSRPSSELSRRWYARSRCYVHGQGVRAGEPVRAPESRCSGAPILTRKRITREERRLAVPPTVLPAGVPMYRHKKKQGLPLLPPVCHWLVRRK